jgi:glycosyltransferase domain-containing protein
MRTRMNKLTVILTLRGRHLYTLRWMWHANRVGLPFHIIIADGEVHPAIERVLSNPNNFPNLSYEYHRFVDISFSDFYRKCSAVISMVKTPYAMMSDNDDFLLSTGILQSIAYLDQAPEYVCAGGEIPVFTVVPPPGKTGKLLGKIAKISFGYSQGVHDIQDVSPADRVLNILNRYHVIYYHVYRTPALRQLFAEVERHDFTDLTIHEYFLASRTASLGKIKSDKSVISYIRQSGTSMLSTYYKNDWVYQLLHSDLPRDSRKMARGIADKIEHLGDQTVDKLAESFLAAYAIKLRYMLGHTMMRHRFPKLFLLKCKFSWLLKLQLLPLFLRKYLSFNAFWKVMSRKCTDKAVIMRYRSEINEIIASLQGDTFEAFATLHAPELEWKP